MYYEKIDGHFDAENVYRFAVAEAVNGARFVEVGPSTARSTCFLAELICASGKDIRLDAIGLPAGGGCDAFLEHLEAARVAQVVQLRGVSLEEYVCMYPARSLDFAFLGSIVPPERIAKWASSVRTGGVLGGCGFSHESPWIIRAVEDRFGPDCAAPPRAWAVRRVADKGVSGPRAFQPAQVPTPARDPSSLQRWHQDLLASPNPALVMDAPRYGEAAVELLLFLLCDDDVEARRAACGSLAALLTPGSGISEITRTIISGGLDDSREDPDPVVRRKVRSIILSLQEDKGREAGRRLRALAGAARTARPKFLRALRALPRGEVARAYRPVPDEHLWDCLDRATIIAPTLPARTECVATLAGEGDAVRLSNFLEMLIVAGAVASANIAAFVPCGDAPCHAACSRYGVLAVPYAPQCPSDGFRLSLLCSVARVVDADRYLCLSVDVAVHGPLSSLFTAMEALHEDSLLICPIPEYAPLSGQGLDCTEEDLVFLTGRPDPLLTWARPNVIGGRRRALLGLDRSFRAMQPFAGAWIDGGRRSETGRAIVVFSLALGQVGGSVPLRVAASQVEVLRDGQPLPLLRLPGGSEAGRGPLP